MKVRLRRTYLLKNLIFQASFKGNVSLVIPDPEVFAVRHVELQLPIYRGKEFINFGEAQSQ